MIFPAFCKTHNLRSKGKKLVVMWTEAQNITLFFHNKFYFFFFSAWRMWKNPNRGTVPGILLPIETIGFYLLITYSCLAPPLMHKYATRIYCTAQGIQPIFYNNYKWSIPLTFVNHYAVYFVTCIILYINCMSINYRYLCHITVVAYTTT